jgi:hypothetical protein
MGHTKSSWCTEPAQAAHRSRTRREPKDAPYETQQFPIINRYWHTGGIGFMVKKVRVFHKMFQFLSIDRIKDCVCCTASLTTQPCEASKNARLGWKMFGVSHSKKPF